VTSESIRPNLRLVAGTSNPYQLALGEVFSELESARTMFDPMHGPHEGYAVLLEEVDELWDLVKANRGHQRSARAEARQIAAMAVAYMVEVAGNE